MKNMFFSIKVFFTLLLLLLSFSGCLFLRPFTPSARLCDESKIYAAMGVGSESYSDYWDYNTINEIPSDARNFNVGVRLRIPSTNFETGISHMGISYTLDIKYGILQDVSKFPIMLAIDTVGYWTNWKKDNFGFGIGPNLNIVIVDKWPLDFVIAGYYQYYDYGSFVEYGMPSRDTSPSRTSAYIYAGFEFPFVYESRASVGCSYAYYFNSDHEYKPVYISMSVKYSITIQRKPSEESKLAQSQDISALGYAQDAKMLIKKKQYQNAEAVLTKGLVKYPDDYMLNTLMGYCAYQVRDLRLSYIYYKKALKLNPGDPPLVNQLKKIESEIMHEKK